MIDGEITQQDAIDLLDRFEAVGIEVVVDGGGASMALLGRQTRPHLDLDIALPAADGSKIKALLTEMRFEQIPTTDTWEHNWVVQDLDLRRVDVHTYVLDNSGRNIGGVTYHAHHLTGHGIIGGRMVRCIPVDVMIEFHLGTSSTKGTFGMCLRFARRLAEPSQPSSSTSVFSTTV